MTVSVAAAASWAPSIGQRLVSPAAQRYDPWAVLARDWPEVEIEIVAMKGSLLGELRYPLLTLRAGTSPGQLRCTLTHELIHLERGIRDCGIWAQREEDHVDREVARRLLPLDALLAGIRLAGGVDSPAELARDLEVDRATLALRLNLLTRAERIALRRARVTEIWNEI